MNIFFNITLLTITVAAIVLPNMSSGVILEKLLDLIHFGGHLHVIFEKVN